MNHHTFLVGAVLHATLEPISKNQLWTEGCLLILIEVSSIPCTITGWFDGEETEGPLDLPPVI